MVIDDDVQGRIDDRLKTGLPFFRIMNEMDVEEYALDAAMEDIEEIRGSDRNRDQNRNIQDPENDQSESFVDDQQVSINVSKNRDGVSSMSSSFQISGSSTLDANDENYGINRKSNMEAIKAMKTRNPADSKTKGPDVIDDVSRGGLSGFSSILRSTSASFTTSVTPGTEAGENDTK
eukprot:716262_1